MSSFSEYVHALVDRIEEFENAEVPAMAKPRDMSSFAAIETSVAVMPFVTGRHIPDGLAEALTLILDDRRRAAAGGRAVRHSLRKVDG